MKRTVIAFFCLMLATSVFITGCDADGKKQKRTATAVSSTESTALNKSAETMAETAANTAPPQTTAAATQAVTTTKKAVTTKAAATTAPPAATMSAAEFSYALSDYEQQVAALVNAERASAGLPAMSINYKLSYAARCKAQDMHDKNYFSHDSPTYGALNNMLDTFGISYNTAGENIARGYSTPQAVMTAWMSSEGHRNNILSAKYTQIGVGYVADGHYWTQEFIS